MVFLTYLYNYFSGCIHNVHKNRNLILKKKICKGGKRILENVLHLTESKLGEKIFDPKKHGIHQKGDKEVL